MEIVFLGTTAAMPTAQRGHPAIALCYRGEVILWDCGESAQRQLIKAKVNFMRTTKIFITHMHADHFLGLSGLIQSMAFSGREKPLMIYGPRGITVLMEHILKLGYFDLGFDVRVRELKQKHVVEGEGYEIEPFRVSHSVNTFGLVFREKKGREFLRHRAEELGIPPGPLYKRLQMGQSVEFGGRVISPEEVLGEQKEGFKVVYTSDTRPLKKVVRKARGAVLIHDATFDAELGKKAEEKLHSTAREAAEVARDAGAKALYMTHISPRYRGKEPLESQAREVFPNSYVAEDFMRVDLKELLP